MCFVNDDYDWSASEVKRSREVSTGEKPFWCEDCCERIPLGMGCTLIEAWEHDACYECGFRHSEDYCGDKTNGIPCINEDGETILSDIGEKCASYQCDVCIDFRTAIHALEVMEGCKDHEAEPLESLWEVFGDMGDSGRVRKYFDHASALFPDRREELWARYKDAMGGGGE